MVITYYGHACFGIRTKGVDLLVDPFISGNPLAGHVDVTSIPADVILITHAHRDHIGDVEVIAARTGAHLVAQYEVVAYYAAKGLKGTGMNIGGRVSFPWGQVKSVNAIHSSVFPDGTSGGQAGGFVIWNDEGCIYHAGDTALTLDMSLIPKMCPPLDAAILPIGDHYTMGQSDAVEAAKLAGSGRVIGCHFDTFDPIRIDHQTALTTFQVAGLDLILPSIGDSITI